MNITDLLSSSQATPTIIAIIIGLVVLACLVIFSTNIITVLQQLRSRLFTRSGLFWTVNLVFMAVSVLHAGIFFGITGGTHDVPGVGAWLGFAVSFFLDLVTVILMQAMLEARYRGEEGRARQFLFFICVCCATSTFANLAISLNDFDAKTMLPHAPEWIQVAAPYVLASFPLFVIMMSIAAEMIVNVRPLESLDEDEYETDEKKRLRILEIRNTYLELQMTEEAKTIRIHLQMKANKALRRRHKQPGNFRWFWENRVDIDAIIARTTEQIKAGFDTQLEALKIQIAEASKPAQKPRITEPLGVLETATNNPGAPPSQADSGATENNNLPCSEYNSGDIENSTESDINPDTDEHKVVSLPQRQRRSSGNTMSSAEKKIRRYLERDLSVPDIATKTGVSESYVRKIRSKIKIESGTPLKVINGTSPAQ